MIAGKATCSRIHEYIFPGGFIGVGPLDRGAGARPHPAADRRDAVVLPRLRGDPRRWRERFLTRWDEVRQLGFDDTFRRMRELCLACSEARFRVGHLGVRQFATAERLGH
jgi:cyclopropane-fatty-acyl-phospholipid synthase